MRIKVVCNNCGIKWERVTTFGGDLELTENLQYNCPNCGSNDFDPQVTSGADSKEAKA